MSEPLVLMPAMMCDFRSVQPQLLSLGRQFSVHLPPVSNAESIEEMARVALESAPEKFALAGVGMGGTVALEMARRAPKRITRLAMIDTQYLGEPPAAAAERDVQMARVRAGRLRDVIREEILAYFPEDKQPSKQYLEFMMTMATDLGPDYYQHQSRAMQRRPDQQGTLRRIRGFHTLILCSEMNRKMLVKRHEFVANLIEDATIKVIEGSAYMATIEQPRALNSALRAWMQRS